MADLDREIWLRRNWALLNPRLFEPVNIRVWARLRNLLYIKKEPA